MAYTHTHSALHFSTPRTRIPFVSLQNPNSHPPGSTRFSFRLLRLKGVVTAKPSKRLVCEVKASSMATVEVFEKEELAVSLAKYVADLSNKFTNERGAFTVCLSGGSLINYLRLPFFLFFF